jgi:UDP:flavonoid glycosyltransferase YjiC (YdhE family)
MRVLFVSLASVGHTYPLIPLAKATREAGHTVRFAAGENVHEPLAANGLRPFRPADAFYEIYAEDLGPELARWRPDLVIHEWGVPGAAAAAREAGIPGIWHGFGRLPPPDIGLEMPLGSGRPHLDICPPSLQDKDFREERIALRPGPFSPPGELPARTGTTIYLTLGTAFGTRELLTAAIDGLAALDAHVIVAAGNVTLGGAVPHNVTVRSWVPQAALWPHVDVVVHHGGSGTMLGALAHGVPQLVLPQGADQFANAAALREAGAALVLEEPSAVADHARTLLRDNGYRDAARALADEIAGMPSPDDVARGLPDYAER